MSKSHKMINTSTTKRSSSESQSAKKNKNGKNCRKCQVTIKQTDNSVECEVCLGWFHGGCVGMSVDVFEFLDIGGVHWFCGNCDLSHSLQWSAVRKDISEVKTLIEKSKNESDELFSTSSFDERFKTLEKKLESMNHILVESYAKLETSIEKQIGLNSNEESISRGLETRLIAMDKNVETHMKVIKQTLTESQTLERSYASVLKDLGKNSSVLVTAATNNIKQNEREQKETRDKNLIIFGVKECETKQETVEKVQQLLEDCHLPNKITQTDIHRLGHVNNIKVDSQGDKIPRPIKLITESKGVKWEILKRINHLKKQGIFTKPDLNKTEREADFCLRQELKKTREENPGNTYKISKNKIVLINK